MRYTVFVEKEGGERLEVFSTEDQESASGLVRALGVVLDRPCTYGVALTEGDPSDKAAPKQETHQKPGQQQRHQRQ